MLRGGLLIFLAIFVVASAADDVKEIPVSPVALSGLLVFFMMLVFGSIGFCCLDNVSAPVSFTVHPLIVGKES